MKTITSLLIILILSACNKQETGSSHSTYSNPFQESCACEKNIKTDSIIFATHVRIKNEMENNSLIFHCASVETGIASVSDMHGNNEHCEAIYDIPCTSSVDTHLVLSEDFKYFTDVMQAQNVFFNDLKNKQKDYFELTLDKDRKISSISKLKIK